MKYLSGFRNAEAAARLAADIRVLLASPALKDRTVRVMEVCGTHTMCIARYGIRGLLPPNFHLVSGPGCPVCVTEPGYVDAAIRLAATGVTIATFGDMIAVPGSAGTLAAARADGADIRVVYGPADALDMARAEPGREFVFLAIGFETTIAPIAATLARALRDRVPNLSFLTAFKLVPPALHALLADPELAIDAFLCPAHVSAVIGADAYASIAAGHRVPCVIAGFEALDVLLGLKGIAQQLAAGKAVVENQYARVVRPAGNRTALSLISRHLESSDARWRGIGPIPASGLTLRPEFGCLDAAVRHGIGVEPGDEPAGCRCGDVIKGRITPDQCPLFGTGCTPDRAIGPCMVSSEGSCAALFKYGEP